MNRFFLRILSVLALLLPLTANAAPVDEYPNGPITAVCTYSVGSQTDVQARICAMPAEKYFGQPIVILNKAGAGGLTGWNWFMDRGSRDGLTMTVYNLPNFIAQSIVKKNAKYSIRTLEPLANFAADPVVLFVSKDSPFNSVSDLVEFARKNPGKVTLNGSGLFVGHHIALLLLAKEADIKLTYVPEKGGSDSLQSVMAGKVMGSFNNLSIAMLPWTRSRSWASPTCSGMNSSPMCPPSSNRDTRPWTTRPPTSAVTPCPWAWTRPSWKRPPSRPTRCSMIRSSSRT